MAAKTTSSNNSNNTFDTGAKRAVGAEYEYRDGDSEDAFIMRNAFGKESGYGLTNFLNPVGGIINAFKGRNAYKKQRAAYEARKREIAKQGRARDYFGKMYELDQMQGQEDNARNDALAAVDDPTSVANDDAQTEQDYQANIGNAQAGLSEDYGRQSQRQGLAAARRGIIGGSNDAEQQADLAGGYQSHLMDATQAALGKRADAGASRSNARSALRRSIETGDPAQAASWTNMARSEGEQSERDSRMMDYYNAFRDLRNQQDEDTSRLIGGSASAIGDSYRMDQQAKGTGGVGLY